MTPERLKELCENEGGAWLTPAEVAEGWHFCRDHDFDPVHNASTEFGSCTCTFSGYEK